MFRKQSAKKVSDIKTPGTPVTPTPYLIKLDDAVQTIKQFKLLCSDSESGEREKIKAARIVYKLHMQSKMDKQKNAKDQLQFSMTDLINKYSNKISLKKRNSITRQKRASPISKKDSTIRANKKNTTLQLYPTSEMNLKQYNIKKNQNEDIQSVSNQYHLGQTQIQLTIDTTSLKNQQTQAQSSLKQYNQAFSGSNEYDKASTFTSKKYSVSSSYKQQQQQQLRIQNASRNDSARESTSNLRGSNLEKQSNGTKMVTFEGQKNYSSNRPSFAFSREERSRSVRRPSPNTQVNNKNSLFVSPISPLEIVKNKILRMRAKKDSKKKIIKYDRENSHEFLNIIQNKIKEQNSHTLDQSLRFKSLLQKKRYVRNIKLDTSTMCLNSNNASLMISPTNSVFINQKLNKTLFMDKSFDQQKDKNSQQRSISPNRSSYMAKINYDLSQRKIRTIRVRSERVSQDQMMQMQQKNIQMISNDILKQNVIFNMSNKQTGNNFGMNTIQNKTMTPINKNRRYSKQGQDSTPKQFFPQKIENDIEIIDAQLDSAIDLNSQKNLTPLSSDANIKKDATSQVQKKIVFSNINDFSNLNRGLSVKPNPQSENTQSNLESEEQLLLHSENKLKLQKEIQAFVLRVSQNQANSTSDLQKVSQKNEDKLSEKKMKDESTTTQPYSAFQTNTQLLSQYNFSVSDINQRQNNPDIVQQLDRCNVDQMGKLQDQRMKQHQQQQNMLSMKYQPDRRVIFSAQQQMRPRVNPSDNFMNLSNNEMKKWRMESNQMLKNVVRNYTSQRDRKGQRQFFTSVY
ncbi:UNKNOWN [Stylonychia lemnae]|uniref:Uncharacterized protein n=1 Tax=Stylonychia lemnae TaxID=5949 RepID=A0A077ZZ46_STYLE|nr:UNKNOWN [Stylonychia lemnae]|eukprot:CDW74842.1 UNKNOWN [Stylonychia lemnae]